VLATVLSCTTQKPHGKHIFTNIKQSNHEHTSIISLKLRKHAKNLRKS